MKEFMLLIYNDINHQESWSDEMNHSFLKECEIYINGLKSKGQLISAQPLIREGKVISRMNNEWEEKSLTSSGNVQVGYYHILADSMGNAIDIAKQNPEFRYGTTAKIEVRPIKTKEEKTGYIYPENEKNEIKT